MIHYVSVILVRICCQEMERGMKVYLRVHWWKDHTILLKCLLTICKYKQTKPLPKCAHMQLEAMSMFFHSFLFFLFFFSYAAYGSVCFLCLINNSNMYIFKLWFFSKWALSILIKCFSNKTYLVVISLKIPVYKLSIKKKQKLVMELL